MFTDEKLNLTQRCLSHHFYSVLSLWVVVGGGAGDDSGNGDDDESSDGGTRPVF